MSDPNSRALSVFHGRRLPEPGTPAGYGALWERYSLPVPLPPRLVLIAERHHRAETDAWLVLTPRHAPDDSLAGHLEFALKWEGVDLGVLRWLFRAVAAEEVAAIVRQKPTGAYARRLWFLYEWLTGSRLDIPDAGKVKAVTAVDPEQQFVSSQGRVSSRHRVIDNMPGPPEFCPLVRRTGWLVRLQEMQLDVRTEVIIGRTHPDILTRAAAFLLLSDSRASFRIEGEQPSQDRALRWAQAIAEAGSVELSIEELERLQRVVIGDARFVHLGLRSEGGFIGDHDRHTGQPIPVHISAKPDDLRSLLQGMAQYADRSIHDGVDPVVVATAVAFGFVYVHPLEDGNGRLHRWLIHHVLAAAGYNPPGFVFPVSAAILRHVEEYRAVLESYSKSLLPLIEWRATEGGSVEVLNETADYYRYFDATAHAAFLYERVQETVEQDLPAEVKYLEAYERFAASVQNIVDMPGRTIDLLHRFLRQNGGRLSKRARTREFTSLTDAELARIESLYRESFADAPEPPDLGPDSNVEVDGA
ncbi:MAG: Fic family protein [Gemmatimonadetes bacterium]|nr:Fic family protein [Gemmatimonadota bacterium]